LKTSYRNKGEIIVASCLSGFLGVFFETANTAQARPQQQIEKGLSKLHQPR